MACALLAPIQVSSVMLRARVHHREEVMAFRLELTGHTGHARKWLSLVHERVWPLAPWPPLLLPLTLPLALPCRIRLPSQTPLSVTSLSRALQG